MCGYNKNIMSEEAIRHAVEFHALDIYNDMDFKYIVVNLLMAIDNRLMAMSGQPVKDKTIKVDRHHGGKDDDSHKESTGGPMNKKPWQNVPFTESSPPSMKVILDEFLDTGDTDDDKTDKKESKKSEDDLTAEERWGEDRILTLHEAQRLKTIIDDALDMQHAWNYRSAMARFIVSGHERLRRIERKIDKLMERDKNEKESH